MTQDPTTETRTASRRLQRWLTGGAAALVLSALLLGGTALAQTDGTTGTDLQDRFITRLAETLGISTSELQTAMTEAGNGAVDDAVADGDLTQEQGDALLERIAGDEQFSGFGRGHGFGGHGSGHRGMHLETIATTLGITTDALLVELQSGTALTDVITAHGKTVQDVVDALVAEKETMLTEAVADGRITQEQADAILAELPARLTEMIESGLPLGGPGHHHPWTDGDDDAADDAETSTS